MLMLRVLVYPSGFWLAGLISYCCDVGCISKTGKCPIFISYNEKLENVANVLQLEAAQRRAVPLRFNFVARAKFEVAQPIRCRLRTFLLIIRYVTL